MRTEFGAQRTVCGCEVCKLNCSVMPGFLIPADLERMIPTGQDPFSWAETNLLCSPGALVGKKTPDGLITFRVPTLVPAVKVDGACINLTADGQCSIHAAAPFGCAFFDCGPEPPGLVHAGIMAVLEAQGDSTSLYSRLWDHLARRGSYQQSPETLRKRMRDELEKEKP